MHHLSALRPIAVAVLGLACGAAASAQEFTLQVGPPIAAIPQPGAKVEKKVTKQTLFVVRPVGCADSATARISGTAEGLVDGVRRRVALTLEPLQAPGVYGVPRDWADSGAWIVHLTGTCDGRTAGALVALGPKDTYRREAVEPVSAPLTAAQIDAALRAAAGRTAAATAR